jgi:2-polyprenyl-3-methyl-5-hydroxy-6-metoxy-1,4-benzoquinol methylase
MSNQLIYDPSIFEQASIEGAKEIVLTPENGISTQTRWDTETPWLLNLISKHIKPSGLIVDYGCGVGRIAGPLVNQGYPVIGIDTSSTMRHHATQLIANERFVAMTPTMLDQLVGIGVKAEGVFAIWILQHCFDLDAEVARIYKTLNKGGIIGVADMRHRAIPTNQGWRSDGKSVKETLTRYFTLVQQYPYNPPNAPQNLRDNAYIAFFQKNR